LPHPCDMNAIRLSLILSCIRINLEKDRNGENVEMCYKKCFIARPAGLEPATPGSEGQTSANSRCATVLRKAA
jgi:hypothetical protein